MAGYRPGHARTAASTAASCVGESAPSFLSNFARGIVIRFWASNTPGRRKRMVIATSKRDPRGLVVSATAVTSARSCSATGTLSTRHGLTLAAVPNLLTTPHRAVSQASVASRRSSSRKRPSAFATRSSSESGGRSKSRTRCRSSQSTICFSSADRRSKESRRCRVAVVMPDTPAHCRIESHRPCVDDLSITTQMQREVQSILIPEAFIE